jgi:FdhD protein
MSDKFSISPTEVHRLEGQKLSLQPDFVAVEEPLEIQLLVGDSTAAQPISVTMRTPGNDESLALGFLFTEGIIKHGSDVQSIHVAEDPSGNALTVQLKSHVTVDLAKLERHFYTTSSCGVCGKASLEAVQQQCNIELPKTQWKVPSQVLYSLPDSLRNQQANFAQTGGIHGCALFDLDGNFILSAEDVGRHNALDKLIGQCILSMPAIPLSNHILMLSGRISFELVQKAAMAGIRFIAAVGAPSSLAIDLAEDMGITLVGFLRGERCNIYTHPHRVNP